MERQTFIGLFKDLISRLYDRVAVETHPLAAFFPMNDEVVARRGEVIQHLVLDEIEEFKPESGETSGQSPEGRSYIILKKRYIDGLDPHEIAKSLYIGDRQFRRDHSRALQALSLRVWQRYFQAKEQTGAGENPDLFEDQGAFEFHAEQLDLNEVIDGVIRLIHRRLEVEAVQLDMRLHPAPLLLFTDRILLRQILLSLLNFVLHLRGQPHITLSTEAGRNLTLCILFDVDEQWANIQNDESDSLEFARRLSQRLPAEVRETYPPRDRSGPAEIRILFAGTDSSTILIIDDHVAAQKMFQRYLSRTTFEVVGITDPSEGLAVAQKTRPALIILDVMMPHIDGWEVLQTLQLDAETKDIPIIVCSAWGEPELARSLGAIAFLKKPVIQKDLFDVLTRLGIIQE
jgi:CheY-like chemotaxis protein